MTPPNPRRCRTGGRSSESRVGACEYNNTSRCEPILLNALSLSFLSSLSSFFPFSSLLFSLLSSLPLLSPRTVFENAMLRTWPIAALLEAGLRLPLLSLLLNFCSLLCSLLYSLLCSLLPFLSFLLSPLFLSLTRSAAEKGRLRRPLEAVLMQCQNSE